MGNITTNAFITKILNSSKTPLSMKSIVDLYYTEHQDIVNSRIPKYESEIKLRKQIEAEFRSRMGDILKKGLASCNKKSNPVEFSIVKVPVVTNTPTNIAFTPPTNTQLATQIKLIQSLITDKKRIDKEDDPDYVHENQEMADYEIIANFTLGNRWALLTAEMQSGKSGTFCNVPYMIFKNQTLIDVLGIDHKKDQSGNVNDLNFFLITGMNDTDLREQQKGDLKSYTSIDSVSRVLHNSDLQRILNKHQNGNLNSTEQIIVNKMQENCLFLVEESHSAANKDSKLDEFLKKIVGVSPTDSSTITDRNLYFLSISATPMAERLNLDQVKGKTIVNLKNGPKYRGVSQILKEGKIRSAFNLNKDSEINKLVKDINQINGNGYIIIRCSDKQQNKIIENLKGSISYQQYDSKSKASKDINDILEIQPTQKEIIFIKGMFRAGKRLEDKYSLMVHDTHSSKVDTTAQSLLGRCCGYSKNKNVLIYCDKNSAQDYSDWVDSGFTIKETPVNSKNVLAKGKSKYSLNKIKILKYDLKSDFEKNYKKNNTKSSKKIILENYIDEKEYLSNHYYIGSFYDKSSKTIGPAYDSKNGFLCLNDMHGNLDNEFDTDFEKGIDPVGKYVITTLLDKASNIIEFSIGKVILQEISTSINSMYTIDL